MQYLVIFLISLHIQNHEFTVRIGVGQFFPQMQSDTSPIDEDGILSIIRKLASYIPC